MTNEELRAQIELAGGRFRGLQPGFTCPDGTTIEALVLFNSPKTGSTLALAVSKVTVAAIRRCIRKSDADFV
jgi:hypothetical protein